MSYKVRFLVSVISDFRLYDPHADGSGDEEIDFAFKCRIITYNERLDSLKAIMSDNPAKVVECGGVTARMSKICDGIHRCRIATDLVMTYSVTCPYPETDVLDIIQQLEATELMLHNDIAAIYHGDTVLIDKENADLVVYPRKYYQPKTTL